MECTNCGATGYGLHHSASCKHLNVDIYSMVDKLQKQRDELLVACKAARMVLDTGYALKLIKAPKNYHVQIDMVLKGLTKAISSIERT